MEFNQGNLTHTYDVSQDVDTPTRHLDSMIKTEVSMGHIIDELMARLDKLEKRVFGERIENKETAASHPEQVGVFALISAQSTNVEKLHAMNEIVERLETL